MKKLQRILSAVLALVLIIGIWPPARAAEEDCVSLSMTASDSTVQAGGTVQVTIEADKDFTSLGSGMTIYYDAKALKLEDTEVRLTRALVDNAENAVLHTLPRRPSSMTPPPSRSPAIL